MPAARLAPAPSYPTRVAGGVALIGVAAWGCFQNLYRLDAANWAGDELTYRFSGWEYVQGRFDHNFDHPFTGKLVLGLGQLLIGRDQGQARLVPAVASLLTGWLVYVLLRREAGFAAALTGLGMWLLLPHSAPGLPVRIDRFGMLEPVLALLSFGVVVAGWRWMRTAQWRWPLLTGLLAGLAMTTKVSGVLVLPAVLFTALAVHRSRVVWSQVIGCAIVAELTAIASYAVAGTRGLDAARYMVVKQSAHRASGHLVTVAGTDYLHPPWWTHLWFQTQSYRTGATVAIAVLALIGLFASPRGLGAYLLAAIAVPFGFLSLGAGVALPFYYLLWQAPLAALATLGAGALWRGRGLAPMVAAISMVPLITLGVRTSGDVLRLRPSGYDLLDRSPLIAAVPARDVVLVLGDADRVAVHVQPGQPVLTRLVSGRRVGAVVVDCAFARRHPRSPVLAYVARMRPRLAVSRSTGCSSTCRGDLTPRRQICRAEVSTRQIGANVLLRLRSSRWRHPPRARSRRGQLLALPDPDVTYVVRRSCARARPTSARRGHARRPPMTMTLPDVIAPEQREDAASVEDLVCAHLPLAKLLARRFAGRGEDIDDLEQVARVGLVNAARRYDDTRGIAFPAFATVTVVGELKHHFRDRRWSVRVPRTVQDLYLRVRAERDRLTSSLQRSPTVAELAAATGASVEDVIEALDAAATFSMASLDATTPDGEDLRNDLAFVDSGFTAVEDREWLVPALATLTQRERDLLRLRFIDELTQREIGRELGVSQMQVSRLLQQIFERLREHAG